jgi:hypothetical protein
VHPVEDHIAPGQRLRRVVDRVRFARPLDESGQRCGLRQGELGCGHSEVVVGCGLNAIGQVSVVHDVEVALEDLVLGEGLFQRHGVLELLQLACVALGRGCLCRGQIVFAQGVLLQRDLDVLLGQRGCTLSDAGTQVGDEGSADGLEVHPAVLEEAAVLDRDLSLSHDRGDLGQRHDDPVLVVWDGNQGAVAGQDAGPLRQRGQGEVAWQRVEDPDPLAGHRTGRPHRRHQQSGAQQPENDRGHNQASEQADDVSRARVACPHGGRVSRRRGSPPQ